MNWCLTALKKYAIFSGISRLCHGALLIIFLSGCVSGNAYSKFYKQTYIGKLAPTKTVDVYAYSESAHRQLLDEGYTQIGYSAFEGGLESNNNAISHGKTIGADIVLISQKYLETRSGVMQVPVYNRSQTYTVNTRDNGVYSATGNSRYSSSNLGAPIYGSSNIYGTYSGNTQTTITTPSTITTTPMNYSVDRYDQEAIFFGKIENSRK